jgi:hypothetical protein
MACCCISSSSVPWWTAHVLSGEPPLALILRNCSYCSRSVFALLPMYRVPMYTGNMQIHDDLGVPYFSDHIRHLTERFDSKLAGVGNPLVARLGRHALAECWAGRSLSRGIGALSDHHNQGFSVIFPQLLGKRHGVARKTGHGPHIPT